MDADGLAFPYLEAILGTGLGVRLMPVGLVALWLSPWNQVPEVFVSALRTRFINVLCVPAGLKVGATVSAAQFGNEAAKGAAYEPPLAMQGLFTVGVPNVAIVRASEFDPKEISTLKKCTAVVCPTKEDADALGICGVKAVVIPPESDQLSRLFSGMHSA